MRTKNLEPIANHIADRNYAAAIVAIDTVLVGESGKDWNQYLNDLKHFIADGIPRFNIISTRGNSKLPFISFSGLPGKRFCPGAGACLDYCYSFQAWRYPAAFARQAQNTILLNSKIGRDKIAADLLKKTNTRKYRKLYNVTMRLYVDGDFRNLSDVTFWFDLLLENPRIAAYGYSKSLLQLEKYRESSREFPENYTLNISGGSKHNAVTVNKIRSLSIVRGNFISVPMHHIKPDNGKTVSRAQVQKEYKASTGKKAFVCPGQCGDCVKKQNENSHFCGSKNQIDVIIAQH